MPHLAAVDRVGVRGDDPHALYLPPGNLRHRLDDLVRQLGSNVAQGDDGFTRETQRALGVPAPLPEPRQFGCCVGCLCQICQKVIDSSGHRSTASARMWSSRVLRALRANDVHSDPQEVLQVLEQADVIKERRAGLEIHEQI